MRHGPLISGWILTILGLILIIIGLFHFALLVMFGIGGIILLLIGVIVLLNSKEDEIEQVKTKGKRR